MIPELLKPLNLMKAFYEISPCRLNLNGEGLLSMVSLDENLTTPESFIYTIDDCINDPEVIKSVAGILSTMLIPVVKPVIEGFIVSIGEPNQHCITFKAVLDMKLLEKQIHQVLKDKDNKPFGNFNQN